MSGSQNYSSPNFVVPYTMPVDTPTSLVGIIKPIYLALQNIVQTMIYFGGVAPRNPASILSSINDPTAILANNIHRFYTQATEAIAAGGLVNLFASGGAIAVRNANATDSTKPCDGFCSQVGGLALGAVGEIILNDGVNSNLSGLTVGTRYYLSTTNGLLTSSPPVAAGNLQQSIGIALATTTLRFWTGAQIQH